MFFCETFPVVFVTIMHICGRGLRLAHTIVAGSLLQHSTRQKTFVNTSRRKKLVFVDIFSKNLLGTLSEQLCNYLQNRGRHETHFFKFSMKNRIKKSIGSRITRGLFFDACLEKFLMEFPVKIWSGIDDMKIWSTPEARIKNKVQQKMVLAICDFQQTFLCDFSC